LGDRIETNNRITSFEQMRSWQDSTNFAVEIYKLTSSFPKSEMFGITSQLRRAVAGVPANIAEGFGRRSNKEKVQFYNIANGSLAEIKSFLYLCEKLKYIDRDSLEHLLEKLTKLQKMINASIRSLR
jgi:four helix bundle protein